MKPLKSAPISSLSSLPAAGPSCFAEELFTTGELSEEREDQNPQPMNLLTVKSCLLYQLSPRVNLT
jgi:hypothetical protein